MKDHKFFLLLLLLYSIVFFYFGCRKEGMFLDELYTYGLSNSHYKPFLSNVKDLSDGYAYFDKADLLDYMEVQKDDRFAFASVYYNQTQDVHPPFHYWMIHLVSSLFPFSHSKWIGLGLNYFFFLLIALFFYKLSILLLGSRSLSAFSCALFFFSRAAISTALYIRMYALLILWTILLAYFVVLLLKGRRNFKTYLGIALTIYAGMMTQYYFVFYVVFLFAAYFIRAFITKQKEGLWAFLLSGSIGAGLLIASYPSIISHMTGDHVVSGTSALTSLLDIHRWGHQLDGYLRLLHDYFLPAAISCGALVFILLFMPKNRSTLKRTLSGKRALDCMVIILPALASVLTVALVSPLPAIRYFINVSPIALLIVPCLMAAISGIRQASFGNGAQCYIIFWSVIMLFSTLYLPDTLYSGNRKYLEELSEKYGHCPVLYLVKGQGGVNPCMTSDLLELTQFDGVFLSVNNAARDKAMKYVSSKKSDYVIVYAGCDPYHFDADYPKNAIRELCESGQFELVRMLPVITTTFRESCVLKKVTGHEID